MQASSPWDDVAFSSTERDRHLGIRPVSQLNTWPVVSPVNASRRPSRDAAHHSGSGRMASPYPMGDFHLLFFASFLAHSELGHQPLPRSIGNQGRDSDAERRSHEQPKQTAYKTSANRADSEYSLLVTKFKTRERLREHRHPRGEAICP